jgi:OHCU decarboxylase
VTSEYPPNAATLLKCCGSTAWAEGLATTFAWQWPHPNPYAAAERMWWALGEDDWREALAAHPRIGDRPPVGTQEQAEQSAAEGADAEVLAALAAGNAAYEKRFGMTYVVRARGRSAPEMLAMLRERLANDPVAELRVAAAQQWEITRLRLTVLLEDLA